MKYLNGKASYVQVGVLFLLISVSVIGVFVTAVPQTAEALWHLTDAERAERRADRQEARAERRADRQEARGDTTFFQRAVDFVLGPDNQEARTEARAERQEANVARNNVGVNTLSATQQARLDALSPEYIRSLSISDIREMTGDNRVLVEIARSNIKGRTVDIVNGVVFVQECTNTLGGTFTFDPPPRVPPSCRGNRCDPNPRDPNPRDPRNPKGNDVVARLAALVLLEDGDGVYSERNRSVVPDRPIYLQWQGINADECQALSGNFSTGGNALGNTQSLGFDPYPGIPSGESATFTVSCSNSTDSDTAALTLTAFGELATYVPPSITIDGSSSDALIRSGDEIDVAWQPNGNSSCALSSQLTGDANSDSSEKLKPVGETTYTISCEGGFDSISVRVLPVIEET